MKKYFVLIPFLLVVYIATLNYSTKEISDKNEDSQVEEEVKKDMWNLESVAVSYNGQDLNMTIDEYVVGVLSCEMPASFNVEALKAGAVAIRTFYLYKQNMSPTYVATNTDQCFINEEAMKTKWGDGYNKYFNIINGVVEETNGEYITYNNQIIESFYFSISNGYTENLENVFGDSRPYLVSVSSSWDKNVSSYEKKTEFEVSEFLNKLGLPDNKEINIEIVSRSSSGRVDFIKVNEAIFKGTEFRKKLGLRSTDFDFKISDNLITFVTRGYGHGVGLSQYGANEMAKLGYSYKEILKHYYQGVDISTL